MGPRAGQSPTLTFVPQHRRGRPKFAAAAVETPSKATQVHHTMPCHGVTAAATAKTGPKPGQIKVGRLENIS